MEVTDPSESKRESASRYVPQGTLTLMREQCRAKVKQLEECDVVDRPVLECGTSGSRVSVETRECVQLLPNLLLYTYLTNDVERDPRTARKNAKKNEKRRKLAGNILDREGKKAHISMQLRHAQQERVIQSTLGDAVDLEYSGPAFKGKWATEQEMLKTAQNLEGFTYVPSKPA